MRRVLPVSFVCLLLTLPTAPTAFAQDPSGGGRGQDPPRPARGQQQGGDARQGRQEGGARQREQGRQRDAGAAAQGRRPQKERVAFGWGRGGRVPVRETETIATPEGERQLVSTYSLRWRVDESGLAVTRQPREFQTSGDGPAQADAAPLRARRVQDLLTPALQIEAGGAFRGFAAGLDPEAFAGKLDQDGQAELAGDLRTAGAGPVAPARARQEARDAWDAWFGAWNGLPIPEAAGGEPLAAQLPTYAGFVGATANADVQLACTERIEMAGETCARLKLTIRQAGSDLATAIRAVPALQELPGMDRMAANVRGRAVEMDGLIGVASGRPHHVVVTRTLTIDDGAGGESAMIERREYAFDWSQVQLMPDQPQGGRGGRGARPAGGAGEDGARGRQPGGQRGKDGMQGQQEKPGQKAKQGQQKATQGAKKQGQQG
jgi:hypothetical protein